MWRDDYKRHVMCTCGAKLDIYDPEIVPHCPACKAPALPEPTEIEATAYRNVSRSTTYEVKFPDESGKPVGQSIKKVRIYTNPQSIKGMQ